MRIWRRLARARREGRVSAALRGRLIPLARGLRYLVRDPSAGRVVLDVPALVRPGDDPDERALVERIFRAFKRMKKDQRDAVDVYLPSAQWQEQLDDAYAPLTEALARDDIGPLHHFLANFGTWPRYTGVESTTVLRGAARSAFLSAYVRNKVFIDGLAMWERYQAGSTDLTRLSYPRHGNQAGAVIDGVFVGPGSFFNEIYGSILAGLIADRSRPVVADLGAGYGKLAYFTLRSVPSWTFIDIDLPETICLAAYYLMKTFPGKRALLYGERADAADLTAYDLVFLPPYAIERIPDVSVDLFINKNSLGEMTAQAVRNYIGHIARATGSFFFHLNHEIVRNRFADGTTGLLAHEYPVPINAFRLLFRYPDIGHLVGAGRLERDMDLFVHLYERR